MKAVVLESFGGPEVLKLVEIPEPKPLPGHVIIRARACALNYADLLQRRGAYSKGARLGSVLGMECAGTVAAIGAGVTGWKVGDPACALVSEGAYAELVSAPATQVMPIPRGVDWTDAAALPEAAATVWSNVVDIAGLAAGETLLVHGGSGGVGSLAIQVANAMGAQVLATAGDENKVARCRDLGARHAINYRTQDFVAVTLAETGGRGANVILDNMGASYFERNINVLANDGRIAMIGLQGGRDATISLAKMMGKRASLYTTSLRDRPDTAKARIVSGVVRDIWPLVERRRVRPVTDRVFPLEAMVEAHAYMDSGSHFGKVLISVG